MDKFNYAIDMVLEHEGGLVDNPNDPGGITNFGISLRWLSQLVDDPSSDVDNDGDVDADDIRAMTVEQAKEFYRKHFWEKYGYDKILNNVLAKKALDMSINMGGKQAHKLIQRALRGVGTTVEDDGILGPITLQAINSENPIRLLPAIRCTQAGFYRALVMRNAALRKAGVLKDSGEEYEDFSVFLKGWLNRAFA